MVNINICCPLRAEVRDPSGTLLYKIRTIKGEEGLLGEGTFGKVELIYQVFPTNEIRPAAIKRIHRTEDLDDDDIEKMNINLYQEALFQQKLYRDLIPYKYSFSVPEVYDIGVFKQTNSIYFLMEPFTPTLVSRWLVKRIKKESIEFFTYFILQLALILEVFEEFLKIDHRDLKLNNMLIKEEPIELDVKWSKGEYKIKFPFQIVIIDFGFACKGNVIDLKNDFIKPKFCPKEGRDMFQALVHIWSIETLRIFLINISLGDWIKGCIESSKQPIRMEVIESIAKLNFLYSVTDDDNFKAPLCAPRRVIEDCMKIIYG